MALLSDTLPDVSEQPRREDQVDRILRQWQRERPDLELASMGVVGRILRSARRLDRGLAPPYQREGLDFGLFDVLATLRRAGPPYRLPPRELKHWCMLTSGAMTARLDRLEALGLIVRLPDPDDRRALLVELSPSGFAMIDRLVREHVENEAHLLESLTPEERDTLGELLRKLLLSLEARS